MSALSRLLSLRLLACKLPLLGSLCLILFAKLLLGFGLKFPPVEITLKNLLGSVGPKELLSITKDSFTFLLENLWIGFRPPTVFRVPVGLCWMLRRIRLSLLPLWLSSLGG